VICLVVGGGGGALDAERVAYRQLFTVEYSLCEFGLMRINDHTLTWNVYGDTDQLLDAFILQSRVPLLEWKSFNPTADLLPLAATGRPGVTYVLERSADLVMWGSIATNTIPADGQPTVTNSIPTTAAQGFFRARATL